MRMAALTVGLVAALVFGGSVKASAQDALIGDFATLCYDHSGDADETLSAADAKGWNPAPRAMLESKDSPFEGLQGRMRSTDDGLAMLFTGVMTQDMEGTPVKMQACAIGLLPMAEGFGDRFRRWVGTGPLSIFGQKDLTLYAVEIEDDGRRTARDDLTTVQATRLLLNNRLHVMGAQNQPENDLSLALYMVPIVGE